MLIRGGRKSFISPPFHDCPSCGAKVSFGVLGVSDTHYIRECRRCPEVKLIDLPRPEKKVIYLDQWVWSGMKQALERVQAQVSLAAADIFFRDLFLRLDRLTKLMLIVSPLSPIHEIESLGLVRSSNATGAQCGSPATAQRDTESYENIRRLLGHLTCGAKFVPSSRIFECQVLTALNAWLRGDESFVFSPDRSEAIPAKINVWLPLFYGALDSLILPEELRALDTSKISLKRNLEAVIDRWRRETGKTFDDWFAQEVKGHGQSVLNAYREHEPLINALRGRFDWARMNYPRNPAANLMLRILERLENHGEPVDSRIGRAEAFFASGIFRQIPLVRLGSALWAGLAHRLVHGGMKNWESSFANDVDLVSAYLPYCDAMFIENTCADLLASNPAKQSAPECDRVFSMRSKDQFLKILNELEGSVSSEHAARVRDVYGDDWDKPALELFFH